MLSNLECAICLEEFDLDGQKPMSLPCCHTMCMTCVIKLYQEDDGRIECPFDKKIHNAMPEQLPINGNIFKEI